ncbi:MAG: circularly permuted type 2 ATP-grasp protein [Burkholderiales bacterium]|nr:circularly permuted type 2 ATP-grasp protein [Burkholderiales bacterium]
MANSGFQVDSGADPRAIALDLARPSGDGHYDELRAADGGLRPAWQQFFTHLGATGFADLDRRAAMLARQIRDDGVTYNVYRASGGGERPWSLDLLPLIVGADEWALIERGAAQRARLLNAVMRDVYGPQRLLRESFLPPALVYGQPGYLRPLVGFTPADGIYLHVIAFDLARGTDGAWWLIGNRTQAPSGLGYALQNRMIVSRLFPEAFRELRVQRLGASFRRLLEMLYRGSPAGGDATPRVVLLTPGPHSETYFEHVYLARYLGIPLVEGGDLTVREERVFLKTLQGLERVHGILRRLDDDYCDPLELRSDSALGVPGLLQAIRAGQVMVANGLGSGFLESPAIAGFLPAIAQRLFGEKLALPSLASWWCGEAAALAQALPELGKMVVKPTSPAQAKAQGWDTEVVARLDERQRQRRAERIRARPDDHTLQEYLPLSEVATWRDGQLTPRTAMLRVYAVAEGDGQWHVLPGGLTRIAGDEQVVTAARGGSSVDTWVLTSGPVETFSMLPGPLSAAALESARRPVTSRAAENLFWMGRYAERAEYGVRLARSTLALLGEDADVPLPLLDTAARLAVLQGLVPAGVPLPSQRLAVFERTLIASLFDEVDSRGVAFSIASLARAGEQIRERLSAEHARLIGQTLAELRAGSAAAGADGVVSDDEAVEILQQLELRLAAVTGAQADRMTRDEGWRLLTIGRQIERLVTQAGGLQMMFETQQALSGDGFELLLQLADSVITYRARHQRWQHPVALVELLVRDHANPRSLACVVRTLRQQLTQLPAPHGEELLARLPPTEQWPTIEMLTTAGADGYLHTLLELVEAIGVAGIGLSESIGSRFFSHADPAFHMVRA